MHKIEKTGIKKGTIVLLHGNSSSSKVFRPLFESDIHYSLVAFDLPGHGASPHSGSYFMGELKTLIKEELNNMEGDIILVGNSYGGHLCLQVLPDLAHVKGVMIFGTPPLKKPLNFQEAYIPSEYLVNFLMPSPNLEAVKQMFKVILYEEKMVEDFTEDFFNTDPIFRTKSAESLNQGSSLIDECQALQAFEGHKVILHGKRDPSVSFDYLKSVQNKAGFNIITTPNAGHYISVEDPSFFIKQLKELAFTCFG